MKEFDSWNNLKKNLNDFGLTKLYHARDIWWCTLGVNIGSEQDGTGQSYERPVLILKGFNKNICLIVPLTTSGKKSKYFIPLGLINHRKAQVIISQIRLVDNKRFINKIGVLPQEKFEKIRKAVKDIF